ncbi:hypothetical protein CTAYLR_001109 [Chrysophaeum taylorii]|uniref:PKD/REJ-like domain-containing protein n=1 Tax=Chrysophaeum taylorii TaxID=2483200 RepID=A0AAD7UNY7_9STRA|nr:hypothetical protein CTAYLR_001109 [Chrysophaeum taylorii]
MTIRWLGLLWLGGVLGEECGRDESLFCCSVPFSLFGGLAFEWHLEPDACCKGHCSYVHNEEYYLIYWEENPGEVGQYYLTENPACDATSLTVAGGLTTTIDAIQAACPTEAPTTKPTNPTSLPVPMPSLPPSTTAPSSTPSPAPTTAMPSPIPTTRPSSPMPTTPAPTGACLIAPRLSRAVVSASGATVELMFDRPTDRAGIGATEFLCSDVGFEFRRGSADLGRATTCRFADDDRVQVFTTTLVPGDVVDYYEGAIQQAGMSGCESAEQQRLHSASVEPPIVPLVPTVALAVPEKFSTSCSRDGLVVDAKSSTGGGGRTLEFMWSVVSGNATLYFGEGGNALVVDLELLEPLVDSTVVISVTATNFLGFESATATSTVFVTTARVPTVVFSGGVVFDEDDGAPTITTRRSIATDVKIDAALCGDEDWELVPTVNGTLSCSWTFAPIGGGGGGGGAAFDGVFESTSKDPRQFYLPPYSLPANSSAMLSATCEDLDTGFDATTTARLVVGVSALAAQFEGGSARVVGYGEGSALVDLVVAATDPDDDDDDDGDAEMFSYAWTCEACPAMVNISNGASTGALTTGDLGLGEFVFGVVATASDGRTATATATVRVVPAAVPKVQLACASAVAAAATKVSPSEKLVCIGAVDTIESSGVDYAFAVSSGELALPLRAASLTALEGSLKAADATRAVYFALPANALLSGASYVFSLRAQFSAYSSSYAGDNNNIAFANVSVIVNQAPTSGTLAVSPEAGETPDTYFDLEAPDWVDDPNDLPLVYAFFHADAFGSEEGLLYPLRAAARASTYDDAVLPPGKQIYNHTVTLVVQVSDVYGALATSTTTAVVTSKPINEAADDAEQNAPSWLRRALASYEYDRALQVLVLASAFINNGGVNCTAATDDYCAERNRFACGEYGDNACGPCLDDYPVSSSSSSSFRNAACRAVTDAHCVDGVQNADETDVDCGGLECEPCADGLACRVDSDCAYDRCDESSFFCAAGPKTCLGGCSEDVDASSTCVFVDPLTNLKISRCTVAAEDSECVARCECGLRRFGHRCEYSESEWEARLQVQATLFSGLGTVLATQVPTTDTTSSQASTLASLCSGNDALRNDNATLLALARAVALSQTEASPSPTFPSAIVNSLSSVLGQRVDSNDTNASAVIGELLGESIDALAALVLNDAVPGEASTIVYAANCQLSSSVLSSGDDDFIRGGGGGGGGGTAATVSLPDPSNRVATGPSVSIPAACADHDDEDSLEAVIAEYGVNPYSSRARSLRSTSTGANASATVSEESASEATVASSVLHFTLSATPTAERRRSLLLERTHRPRSRRRLDARDCDEQFNVTIPTTRTTRATSSGGSVTLRCLAHVDSNGTTYTDTLDCGGTGGASHREVSLACDGTSDETLVVDCEAASGPACARYVGDAWNVEGCILVENTATNVVCSCDPAAVLEEADYAARSNEEIYAKYVKESFDRPLDDSLYKKNALLLTTLGSVIGFFVLAALLGVYLDERDSAKRLAQLVEELGGKGGEDLDAGGAPQSAEGAGPRGGDNNNNNNNNNPHAVEGVVSEAQPSDAKHDPAAVLSVWKATQPSSSSSSGLLPDATRSAHDDGRPALSVGASKWNVARTKIKTLATIKDVKGNAERKEQERTAHNPLTRVLPSHHRELLERLEAQLPAAPALAQGARLQKLERRLKRTKQHHHDADVEGQEDVSASFLRHKLLLGSAMPAGVETNPLVKSRFKDDQKLMNAYITARHSELTESDSFENELTPVQTPTTQRRWFRGWWSTAKVAFRTVASDHSLFSIFYVYDPRSPRALRSFVACIMVIQILFAETVAYWYTQPVGICEDQNAEDDCEEIISPTGFISHRKLCVWDPFQEDHCQFRDPSAAQEHSENAWEAFICVIVALPIIAAFEYLWTNYLVAPYRLVDDNDQDEDDDQEEDFDASTHASEQAMRLRYTENDIGGAPHVPDLIYDDDADADDDDDAAEVDADDAEAAANKDDAEAAANKNAAAKPPSKLAGLVAKNRTSLHDMVKAAAEECNEKQEDDLEPPPPPPAPEDDDEMAVAPEHHHRPKHRIQRELGLLLLHNLGVIDDSDTDHFGVRGELLGVDGLPLELTRAKLRLPHKVKSSEALIDWFALRATGAAMRALLYRRQEFLDALEDLLEGGESVGNTFATIPETVDFRKRKEILNKLIRSIEVKWSCPPLDATRPGRACRAVTALAQRRTNVIAGANKKGSVGKARARNSEYMHRQASRSTKVVSPPPRPSLSPSPSPKERRKVAQHYKKFARRTFENLRDNLAVACDFHTRHDNADHVVGASSLSRARTLYQLMFLEFFDLSVERAVYARLLQIDDERELRHLPPPVTRAHKVVAGFLVFLLIVGPVYFMLVFGRRLGKDEMKGWFGTAMLAGSLIVFLIEPLRILFVNLVHPQLLVPKMEHYHDPCQVVNPFRTPLSVSPADLVPDAELAEAFTDSRVQIPRRLALAPAARIEVTRRNTHTDDDDDNKIFSEPLVKHEIKYRVSGNWKREREISRVLGEVAEVSAKWHNPDVLEPSHLETNREFRKANAALWSDASLGKLEQDLDWQPPGSYALSIAVFSVLTSFNSEIEEMILEETVNLIIGISSTIAGIVLAAAGGNAASSGVVAALVVGCVCISIALVLYAVFSLVALVVRCFADNGASRPLTQQQEAPSASRESELLLRASTYSRQQSLDTTIYDDTDNLMDSIMAGQKRRRGRLKSLAKTQRSNDTCSISSSIETHSSLDGTHEEFKDAIFPGFPRDYDSGGGGGSSRL